MLLGEAGGALSKFPTLPEDYKKNWLGVTGTSTMERVKSNRKVISDKKW